MMLDDGLVAVSPSSVYRVLKTAGLLKSSSTQGSKKGTGFHQPTRPHQHWHTDVSHINIQGTFYYLCAVLDGFSRYIVHWDIRESMKEEDVTVIIQRARETFPDTSTRLVSDNGPQFIAKDFKEFIRISGMSHVRTSPYYPQSNGKMERWNGTVKKECIRPKTPTSLEDAQRIVRNFVNEYNTARLHSAIGYITPKDMMEGRAEQIKKVRQEKLREAKDQRAQAWSIIQHMPPEELIQIGHN